MFISSFNTSPFFLSFGTFLSICFVSFSFFSDFFFPLVVVVVVVIICMRLPFKTIQVQVIPLMIMVMN